MTSARHPEHGVEDLCRAGAELYERALREGQVNRADADTAPCLIGLGLLHPTATDPDRLEPVAPASVLHRLLRMSAERIADERRREERLERFLGPLARLGDSGTAATEAPALTVLDDKDRINTAISAAIADATDEILAIQPSSNRDRRLTARAEAIAVARDQTLLDRGGRIRTLYQHTHRYNPYAMARYENLRGDAEARTLDEVTDRLIVIDRQVAFIPANADRTTALEVRHPALLTHFVTVFDRLWHLATPMYPEAVQQPSLNGISPRQHAIAGLLVEGHTDAVIAHRLGMNIRTARVHIAKLAATLGSESRAQLGYLIGQSGILREEGATE
ncbi:MULTISPECIES: helix-turn-helix transcriptional regulator [unclassified Streptomyces]|uniref:helix-turn-helix transcriptional regulator n=1 Tax=unclassified Streptomyces TaxID=2593676 RepID=UPI00190BA1DA|nr:MULTISPECIES: helix-turn-helix transcriptional regulator [unclassified Streptomyces]MBK3565311.1 helix-turn-helix transcriptional regulator [Streptomyces sp. MBT62]MBK6015290.1 helix-turn-helix transcriptional regulator [Streptomyces sp. MBT53]